MLGIGGGVGGFVIKLTFGGCWVELMTFGGAIDADGCKRTDGEDRVGMGGVRGGSIVQASRLCGVEVSSVRPFSCMPGSGVLFTGARDSASFSS